MKQILIALFLLQMILIKCQYKGFENLTTQNGLSSNTTYAISQDDAGFIWIGSDNGLNRYDGNQFTIYQQQFGFSDLEIVLTKNLSKNRILAFLLTRNVIIDGGKMIQIELDPQYDIINSISAQIGNNFFIISKKTPTLYIIDEENQVKKRNLYDKNDQVEIIGFWKNSLVAYVNGKLQLIDLRNYNRSEIDQLKIYPDNEYSIINDQLVVKSRQSLKFFYIPDDWNLKEWKEIPFQGNIKQISINNNDDIWLISRENGLRFYPDQRKKNPLNDILLLQDYNVNYVMEDKDGNIWFSTNENGIFFITKNKFENLIQFPDLSLSTNIKSIDQNLNEIYFTDSKKIMQLTDNDKKIVVLTDKIDNIREVKSIHDKLYIVSNQGLFMKKGQEFYKVKPIAITSYKSVNSFNEQFIINTSLNTLLYNPATDQYKDVLTRRSYTSCQIDDDYLFTGTTKGLYKVNVNDNTYSRMDDKTGQDLFFTDIVPYGDKYFVASTNAYGIFLLDKDNVFKNISKKNGLSDNNVKNLFVDHNNIWVCTFNGLNKIEINPDNLEYEIKLFNEYNYLPSSNINDVLIKDGQLYIASDKGLTILPNSKLTTSDIKKSSININYVTVNNVIYYENDELPKLYSNYSIGFNVSNLDYASYGKTGFRYRLVGLDNGWVSTRNKDIKFNNLPPGEYEFEIYGTNGNNQTSSGVLLFHFKIEKRLYQQSWFIIIIFLLLLAITIYIVYIITNYNVKKRTAVEKRIANLELTALKSQLNPHFIANCLNSISFLVHKGEMSSANNYIEVFSKMIRQNLNYSDQNFLTVDAEVEHLDYYMKMEQLRFGDAFEFQVEIDNENTKKRKIPTFIVQPFIENSIKHAFTKVKKGIILLRINSLNKHQTEIIVMDNGKGINTNSDIEKKNSFGLSLVLSRIDTYNKLYKTNITYEIGNAYIPQMKGAYIKLIITTNE